MLSPIDEEVISPQIVTEYDDEETDEEYQARRTIIIDGKAYKPGMFLPGQSGNPKGRPKGKSLKEWTREFLERMTDEERMEYLKGLPKDVIWRMAEGNPTEDRNVTVTVPKPILGGMTQSVPIEEQTMNALESPNSEDIGPGTRGGEGEG